MRERRRYVRQNCCFDVAVGGTQRSPLARVVDFSPGGASLITHDELPINLPVVIEPSSYDGPALTFTVRNVRPAEFGWYQYGLEFTGAPSELLLAWLKPVIKTLVRPRRQGGPVPTPELVGTGQGLISRQ